MRDRQGREAGLLEEGGVGPIGEHRILVALALVHEIQRFEIQAIGGVAFLAGATMAARPVGEDDLVARSEIADVLAHRLDRPRAFMAKHDGKIRRQVAVLHSEVGVAHAHRGQFHQHLMGAGIVDGCFDDFEIRSGFFDHGDAGLVGHGGLSLMSSRSTAALARQFRRASRGTRR